ncbi:DUF6351 family protein [Phytoactinopolyspora mesophila]|uniref:DUF6351 domain-containing protein n=1 Tax=Phytoactinopolyspora mesophila TaxID=2650750 RepID=A0A7K3LX79_9ACTN|nr:DUF6351 family protein [Phytoactinopolyspora mesophila]NDL55570.1 hypothetical protein [Phytoactinopolyspora mesophila]
MRSHRAHARVLRHGLHAGLAFAVAGTLAIPGSLAGAGGAPNSVASPPDNHMLRSFQVDTVSGPADLVTGGSALVRIDVPRSVPAHQVRITLNGRDVRDAFQPYGSERVLLGHVDGLTEGANTLEVRANGRGKSRPAESLTLVNHPLHGPVFSGPHIPLYCTADASPWNLGLVDEHCHVEAPVVTYQYRTTAGSWAALPDDEMPEDVATTVTSTGETVPYVVRVEQGTINRSVYETAILHEPGTPVPDPWTSTPGWNGRLVYTFGGGCGIGHTQATETGGVLDDTLLGAGYATASSTFNVYQQNCNDVTSAETAMMVKERFTETYGVPDFTMGWGSSAGTMQQLLISNAYPGILDGVIGHIGYPDERSTTISGHECRFVTEAISSSELDWTAEQGKAVTGFARFSLSGEFGTSTCAGYMFFPGVDYPADCPGHIPPADRYHPVTNPDGIRCAIADFVSTVYGTDPGTGFGRPIVPDTVGVQYGLEALEAGMISAEQFVDLNERIGGVDRDGQRITQRSAADPEALEVAYATGRINQFDGGLRWTPIIETRGYADLRADFHDRIRSWSMRERLLSANGHADNHVSWTSPEGPLDTRDREEALAAMDDWLTTRMELAAQEPDLDPVELTRRAKPGDLTDGCVDEDGQRIDEELTLDPSARCNQLFPFHATPRAAAGGPLAADVLACQLEPLDRSGYGAVFTGSEWQRLNAVFPDGVCDWSLPGAGQVELSGTWTRF